uniref:Uncharacterized protein n=1 Tax=uncultured prokaryote TaxID=198431 RepID=A0A0H5Q4R1_9ZZZZ|nr:hypothetical protein [uncultured prokaryote]
MPYLRQHNYVTWFGDAYTEAEEWQVGLRLDGTGVPDLGQMQELDAAMEALLTSGINNLPPSHRYLGCKVAPIGTDGKYFEGGNSVDFLRETPLVGNAAPGYPQIALVISMRTQRSRGRGSNGRMYLPSSTLPNQDEGLIAASTAASVATAGALFVADVNDVGLGAASVFSTISPPLVEPITGVRVGRVMDTQRRRRNQLPETHSAVAPLPS